MNDQPTAPAVSQTPRTDGIMKCLEITWAIRTDYEHWLAAKEGAMCGIEALERELRIALAAAETARDEAKAAWENSALVAIKHQEERDALSAQLAKMTDSRDSILGHMNYCRSLVNAPESIKELQVQLATAIRERDEARRAADNLSERAMAVAFDKDAALAELARAKAEIERLTNAN